MFQVGYYTEVAGLGYMPQDTVINGAIDVFNNSCTPATSNCNSDNNFWRSMSNLTLNVDRPGSPPVYAPPVVILGAPVAPTPKRVGRYPKPTRSGGSSSMAASSFRTTPRQTTMPAVVSSPTARVTGNLDFYGNQQYLVRNSDIGGAVGARKGLWNIVYSGVQGAPSPVLSGQCQQNTVLPTSPVTEEEPFLYWDGDHGYQRLRSRCAARLVWAVLGERQKAGTSVPSRPSSWQLRHPTPTINTALALGRNLVLTPGIYDLTGPSWSGTRTPSYWGRGSPRWSRSMATLPWPSLPITA